MKKYQLKSLIDVKRGASLAGEYYSSEGSLVRLTLGNFKEEGGFKFNTSKDNLYYTGPVKDEYILKKGDIITPLTEQVVGLLGATARIPESDKYVQSGDVALIKSISDELYEGYCYYLISSDVVRRQLSAAAQQTKIRHTSPEKIKSCQVFLPDVSTQKKISNLLDVIDKKISLNITINDNLVQQVSDIFNYWFTQFDFPNTSGKPYKSSGGKMIWNSIIKREIPESWSVATYDTICSYENGDRSENYPSSDDFVERGIPFINGGAINGNSIDTSSLQYISKEKYNSLRAGKVSKKDILLTLRGSLDKCIYSPFEISAIASALVILRAKQKIFSSYLYYSLKSQYFKQLCSNYNNGSVQTNLSVDVIKRFPCIIPSSDILQKFDNYASQIDNKLLNIFEENEQLLSLRSWLLPILMNGQATISD